MGQFGQVFSSDVQCCLADVTLFFFFGLFCSSPIFLYAHVENLRLKITRRKEAKKNKSSVLLVEVDFILFFALIVFCLSFLSRSVGYLLSSKIISTSIFFNRLVS